MAAGRPSINVRTDLANTLSGQLRASGVTPKYTQTSPDKAYDSLIAQYMGGTGAKGLDREVFSKAFQQDDNDLDGATLSKMWELADVDKDGWVAVEEYTLACNRLKKVRTEIPELRSSESRESRASGAGAVRGSRSSTRMPSMRAESRESRESRALGGAEVARTSTQQAGADLNKLGVVPTGRYAKMDPSKVYDELFTASQSAEGLDKDALRKAVCINGETLDESTFDGVWRLADRSKDGIVSAEEFKHLYHNILLKEIEDLKKELGGSAMSEEARVAAKAVRTVQKKADNVASRATRRATTSRAAAAAAAAAAAGGVAAVQPPNPTNLG